MIFFAKMEDKYDTIQGNLIFIEVIGWRMRRYMVVFMPHGSICLVLKVDLRSFVLLFLTELVLKDII